MLKRWIKYCMHLQCGSSTQEGSFTTVSKSGQHIHVMVIPPWEVQFGMERWGFARRDGPYGRQCLTLSRGEAILIRQLNVLPQTQLQRWMLLNVGVDY